VFHGKLRGAETPSKVSNTVKADLGLSEVLEKSLNVNFCDREGFMGICEMMEIGESEGGKFLK
jgi:hypothetical protein